MGTPFHPTLSRQDVNVECGGAARDGESSCELGWCDTPGSGLAQFEQREKRIASSAPGSSVWSVTSRSDENQPGCTAALAAEDRGGATAFGPN
jgi:hypothetical protein